MTTYVLVRPDNTVDRRQDNIDPTVQTKAGWRWLPLEITKPSFNPDTEIQSGPVTTVLATKVTDVWSNRPKTALELDNDKVAKVDGLDLVVFQVLFNHENRIRVLEAKPTITAAQFKTGIKALL